MENGAGTSAARHAASFCAQVREACAGLVEGFNNKIRAIQKRAYGLRDEEYLRLKILTCMLEKL